MQVHDFNTLQLFLRQHDVFNRFGLTRLGVFGSLSRGESNFQDIDLLVEDDNPDFRNLLALKIFLEEKLGKRVDIVIKKFGDPIILYRAEHDMKYATVN